MSSRRKDVATVYGSRTAATSGERTAFSAAMREQRGAPPRSPDVEARQDARGEEDARRADEQREEHSRRPKLRPYIGPRGAGAVFRRGDSDVDMSRTLT